MRARGHGPGRCVPEEQLALLAGGDLAEGEATAALAHVACCEACGARLEGLRAALAWTRRAAEPPFGAHDLSLLRSRVAAAVGDRPPPARSLLDRLLSLLPSGRGALALGAAAAAVFVAALLTQERRGDEPVLTLAPAPEIAPAPVLDGIAEPAPLDEAPDLGDEERVLGEAVKIELRTSDPKIRIVWLAHR